MPRDSVILTFNYKSDSEHRKAVIGASVRTEVDTDLERSIAESVTSAAPEVRRVRGLDQPELCRALNEKTDPRFP